MIYSSKQIGIKDGKLKNLPSPGERGLRGGGKPIHPHPLPTGRQAALSPAFVPHGGASRRQASRERGKSMVFISLSLIPLLFLVLSFSISYSATKTFKDEVGREAIFPFPPKRIVSLAPNITEILFSLGLDEEIVGVSIHCNFPEKAKSKVRVGSYIRLDFEKITSLNPDLIIATAVGNTRDMVDRLWKLGFPTYVIYPKNFNDILKNIAHIGQVVDREEEARVIIKGMRKRSQRIVELTNGLPRPKVFVQIGDAPIVTVGKGSFADDVIRLAGGDNIAGKEKEVYPRFGMEEILKRSPEVIVISSMNPRGDYQKILQEWNRWKTIPAVKNGRIHLIDSDLLDRPSPRIIDGLEEFAKVLHPEKFEKPMQN
jgi:iron complex transport system substrate-binding protein